MTATITAIDTKAGTITVEAVEGLSPNSWYYFSRSFADILKEEYPEGLFPDGLFGVTRSADVPARLAGCRLGRPPPGTLSAPAVVALTTLCAMEWLRHRKQAVAEAERSGDYAPLLAEFIAWLRALFAEWRAALHTPSCAAKPR